MTYNRTTPLICLKIRFLKTSIREHVVTKGVLVSELLDKVYDTAQAVGLKILLLSVSHSEPRVLKECVIAKTKYNNDTHEHIK